MINSSDFHAVISDADMQTMIQAMDQISKILNFKVQLTPTDRSKLSNVSDRRLAFIMKAHDYSNQFPDAVAPYMKMGNTHDNFESFMKLTTLIRRLDSLRESLSDTSMVASSQVYGTYTKLYSNMKMASESGVSGIDDAIEDMAVLFKKATNGANGDSDVKDQQSKESGPDDAAKAA